MRALLLCLALGAAADAQDRPNVLFVCIDDLNDWIEPLGGHPQAVTPHLSRLARESVCFRRAYCASPGCGPSRAAVMTGFAPYRSGVYSNYQDWRELIPEPNTLGAHLRAHGYYSAGAGKIFHYHMVDPTCWDAYWPSQTRNMPPEVFPDFTRSRFAEPGAPAPRTMDMPPFPRMYGMFDWAPLDVDADAMGDAKSVEYVLGQLAAPRDQPFFLACGIYRPHLPWYVPREHFERFPLDEVQLPRVHAGDLDDVGPRVRDLAARGGGYHEHVLAAGRWREAVQGYLASIHFADAMLGRLLDGLAASEHADDTIVVVWSDHGWQLGEKQHWRKFALWENVARSVLMIRAPAGTPGLPEGSWDGVPCDRVVSLLDLYPTLTELCGVPAAPGMDGRSLVPLLRDPRAPWEHVALTSYDHGEFSVRSARYRYTVYVDGSEELYDHQVDPEEWTNLAADPAFADVVRRMAAHVPADPAPLLPTSQKLQDHHVPPMRSRADYEEWVAHGKDDAHLVRRYWQ